MTHDHNHESHCHCDEQELHGDCCSHEETGRSHGCACCNDSHEHGEDEEMSWWKPALSLTLLAIGMAMSAMDVQWFQNTWIRLLWYLAAWLPTGLGVLREAIEEAREGEFFSEFLLMTVASIGAFAIGEYPEAVAVMALYCIGEALQDRAVDHARGKALVEQLCGKHLYKLCLSYTSRSYENKGSRSPSGTDLNSAALYCSSKSLYCLILTDNP